MTFNTYLVDHVKGVILSLIFAVPLLYIILWVMSDFNKLWWLYTFFILAGFNLLLMSIYPNIIAPLFNKFTPLTDTELKGKIDVLLSKCGFISNGVFVMDGSKRSNHGNAYFTGFGKNKRIVFYDTLLNNLTHDEVLAVLAHELGHFSKKHIINQMAFMFSMIFVVLYVLHLMMNQDWFYALFNISYFNNACALVGFIILSSFLSLPFAPIYNLLARKHEFEADHYAKQNSDKKDLISGLVKLYKDNASTLTPDSLYVKFYYSHPPASMRIAKLEE